MQAYVRLKEEYYNVKTHSWQIIHYSLKEYLNIWHHFGNMPCLLSLIHGIRATRATYFFSLNNVRYVWIHAIFFLNINKEPATTGQTKLPYIWKYITIYIQKTPWKCKFLVHNVKDFKHNLLKANLQYNMHVYLQIITKSKARLSTIK